jgi:5-methylcytosine-specific restriction endonuclease McrA
MDAATRELARQRAGNRCEYCRLAQEDTPLATFHIEHIVARKHGGSDDPSNLALACYHCNLHKGTNLTGIDPISGAIVPLFHPRQQAWHEHFAIQGLLIVGLTPTGRATVRVLMMNAVGRLQLRAGLQ